MKQLGLFAGIVVGILVARPMFGISVASPGRFAAASSTEIMGDPIPNGIVATTVELTKGKKRRMLLVTVDVAGQLFVTADGTVVSAYVSVNGVDLEPTTTHNSSRVDCRFAGGYCQGTRTFWLDLDLAEAASPGTIIGQPLVIAVTTGLAPAGCSLPGLCPDQHWAQSIQAHMVRK